MISQSSQLLDQEGLQGIAAMVRPDGDYLVFVEHVEILFQAKIMIISICDLKLTVY
jgi:hypothetical protein